MAISVDALKSQAPLDGGDAGPQAGAPARPAASAPGGGGTWLIGRMAICRQVWVLGGALAVLLAAIVAMVVVDTRQGAHGTVYIASAGNLQTLSQRLAKAAQQASQAAPDHARPRPS
jgi:twitching motility protein PilJ